MRSLAVKFACILVALISGRTVLADTLDPITAEPNGVTKVRFISFVVPATTAGTNTAIRVRLASLHHPTNPPPGTPDFSMHEGTFRYLNSFGGSLACVDNATLSTNYRCGQLGCDPEYRDWATDLSFATNPAQAAGLIHVSGSAVVPSSTFEVSSLEEACGMRPEADTCAMATAAMMVSTSKWADVGGSGGGPPDDSGNTIDIGLVVDRVKGLPAAVAKRRAWLKSPIEPVTNGITVVDVGFSVDALKGFPYPYSIEACD